MAETVRILSRTAAKSKREVRRQPAGVGTAVERLPTEKTHFGLDSTLDVSANRAIGLPEPRSPGIRELQSMIGADAGNTADVQGRQVETMSSVLRFRPPRTESEFALIRRAAQTVLDFPPAEAAALASFQPESGEVLSAVDVYENSFLLSDNGFRVRGGLMVQKPRKLWGDLMGYETAVHALSIEGRFNGDRPVIDSVHLAR